MTEPSSSNPGLDDSGSSGCVIAVPRESDIPAELTRLERRTIADGVLSPPAGSDG